MDEQIGILPEFKTLAIGYTRELVRRNSENPPGNELEVASYIAAELQQIGFDVEFDEFESKRCNVVATYGDKNNIGIIFQGHMDVVPATGDWTYEKFSAKILDGRMFGRGTCDMKGGVAAAMAAGAAAVKSGKTLKKGLQLVFVSDEESCNKGVLHLISKGGFKSDAAVICEPTGLAVLLGNKGYSSFYVKTLGISCHASQPERGENAIYKMAKVIKKLEAYSTEISKKNSKHLGNATLSVGTIKGGSRINVVPDECVCEVERRLLAGETCENVLEQLRELVGDLAEVTVRAHTTPPSLIEETHPLVLHTSSIVSEVLGETPKIGVFTGGTEAAFISQYGIPTIILGPGNLLQAHSVDEYVEVSQIENCTDIYYRLINSLLL
ncbi:MAG: M20 family metallopeptidase [Oscillospiraceae bacterium]